MTPAPLVLELDLHTPLITAPPQDPLNAIRARQRTQLTDVLEGLRRAANDPKVAGLIARCDSGAQPTSVVQEIRAAVREFAQSGKPTVAWAQTFGEMAPGTIGYYTATAFDEIWLQPSGDVVLPGLNAPALFLRGALDRLGLQPELAQRYEYKNAADMFTQPGFTDAHREALGRIVESTADQIISEVATARGIDRARLRELVDSSMIPADDARSAGLVDRIGYRDDAYTELAKRLGGRMRLRYVGRYNHAQNKNQAVASYLQRKPARVAVIHGRGPVTTGRSSTNPLGSATLGADTIGSALRAAVKDESVRAIVFRVDSPGGSYVGSDTIRNDVRIARRSKPVIASLGSVAGSGGYFVTMCSDAVVASPATITGSIGVLAGKFASQNLLDRLGVAIERVSVGAQADMFEAEQSYSEEQWEILNRWLDRVYEDFTAKVAVDRGLSREHVEGVARGRIWTGADAYERGLVDELGGLATAIQIARDRAGLPRRDDLADVQMFPRVPFVERLKPPENSQSPANAGVSIRPWGSLTHLATALGLPAAGPLTMPFWTGGTFQG
ncbi:signal peptide peptidase SppA [Actinobacteria bacterium YIM 96077]|uniref:Signal peptide peptidase SppA n=1 Tax=Phytoactinopolyspora halophila TaxID=1981511 RepID=A0A329R0K4_9ACTN|nr:signal peptide peptidase SppA [Phytoactinopolyspora halophila]AYY12758.1 signal peptide peptidase SppA [Actinobacteria bacterium YIM 96077]RAW16448.1 signal peptide peptidase SppA [Phytoactinopolyspora halophila]